MASLSIIIGFLTIGLLMNVSTRPLHAATSSPAPHNNTEQMRAVPVVNTAAQIKSYLEREKIEPPLITPLEETTVALLTHTADFTLYANDPATAASDLTLALNATYRFENRADLPVTVILKIAETDHGGTIDELSLTADGQPLTLFLTEGVGYTTQLQVNGDTRTTVRLQYTVSLMELPLPLLSYRATDLTAWPGSPSLRVSIALPASITPDSWLHIAPDGWHHATTTDSINPLEGAGVKWLYDAQIPQTQFLFEFIHPSQWAQLQQLTAAANSDGAAYLPLGDRYRILLDATPATAEYQAVRERFYAQALAAYTAGIDTVPVETSGPFYAALASLYRIQVAEPDGSVNPDYAAAMVDAAQQALVQLPLLDNRRHELSQWVADGQQIRLTTAQQAADWPTALAIIEQLSALPSDLVNGDMLERTKRSIVVQQALQLLETDHRDGAVALAGNEVLDETLLPPLEQLPLFQRWEISATVSPTEIGITVVPIGLAARRVAAQTAFDEFMTALQRAADRAITMQWQPAAPSIGAERLGRLSITAPIGTSFASLTTTIAPLPQWALLHALLRQLQPTSNTQAGLLNQRTELRLPLDLQAANDEWYLAAATLENAARAMAAEAATRNTRDATEAESALQLRIQAANYRAAAAEWQRLSRDSWVAVQLTVPAGLQETSQTWLLTTASPATFLALQSAPGYAAAFMSVLALSIAGLLFLSGLLWWLL